MAKTGKVFSKKELTEAFREMVETMVLEEGGKAVQPSGDFEKLKAQIVEAAGIITEDDEFSEATADVIEWVLDNLEAPKEEEEDHPALSAEEVVEVKKEAVKEKEGGTIKVVEEVHKKKEAPGKEKKPSVKAKKFEGATRTAFGAFEASGAGKIDAALLAGDKKTLDDIVKETGQKKGRVLSHLYTLVHKKQVVTMEKDENGITFYRCTKQ